MKTSTVRLVAGLSVMLTPALGAQIGRGATLIVGVADAETGQPLEGAEVVLMDVHRLARANALGEAIIANVPRGTVHVRVRRLGYSPGELDVSIGRDTTGAVFRLQRSAVQLGTVNVEADAIFTPPRMKDVAVRQKQGIGRFLDEVELAKDADRDFGFAMTTRFPGLKTVIDLDNNRVLASSRESLHLTKSGPQLPICPITIYLDDVLVQSEVQEMLRTWDLAVVEYYDGLQVPVRYRTRAYGCGVMLLWSKWY